MNRAISTVWVIGLGTAGTAVVALLARGGVRVVAVDTATDGARRVREALGDDPDALGLVEFGAVDAFVDADFVVEALPERVDDKCALLADVHTRCRPDTIFLTTTTRLSVTEIASRSGRMTRTLGLHVPDFTTLDTATAVEVVRTPLTEPAAGRAVDELLGVLGRTPVVVHDHPGFLGGALVAAYLNSAALMYEEGYGSRDDIDAAMTMGCGLPVGPLAQLDAIGLDVIHDSLTALHARSGDKAYAPAAILTSMVGGGLLGAKSGQGFCSYDEARRQLPDPAAPNAYETGQVRPVRHIGIVGSGGMATGIAEVCVRGGYPVTLVARTELRAKEARAAVERSFTKLVRRGRMTGEELAEAVDRLDTTVAMAELANADLVIEAVVEDLDVKLAIFAKLDAVARPGAVLATVTSSLPVIRCAMATRRPQDVVGMHFFNPAPKTRLIEVVRTFASAGDAVATIHDLAARLGKHTVNCTDRTGFIVNALLFPYLNRAVTLLRERNDSVDDVDTVMTGAGDSPLGPFQLLDLVGLDVSLAIRDRLPDVPGVGDHTRAVPGRPRSRRFPWAEDRTGLPRARNRVRTGETTGKTLLSRDYGEPARTLPRPFRLRQSAFPA